MDNQGEHRRVASGRARAWRLGIGLAFLVLTFDVLSVCVPGPMARGGILFAFAIVGSVIGSALYHVRALNLEERGARPGAEGP